MKRALFVRHFKNVMRICELYANLLIANIRNSHNWHKIRRLASCLLSYFWGSCSYLTSISIFSLVIVLLLKSVISTQSL